MLNCFRYHIPQDEKFIFRHDWIKFYDGEDQSGSILGCGRKWCGNSYPEITSIGNKIFIEFYSDLSFGATGFNISYEAGKN